MVLGDTIRVFFLILLLVACHQRCQSTSGITKSTSSSLISLAVFGPKSLSRISITSDG
ncbi:Uncharacterised protein [Chlamydia abortus]|nr:Uncharacterised protein [Chlamydia abortus]